LASLIDKLAVPDNVNHTENDDDRVTLNVPWPVLYTVMYCDVCWPIMLPNEMPAPGDGLDENTGAGAVHVIL
jgi:hypothetical protein